MQPNVEILFFSLKNRNLVYKNKCDIFRQKKIEINLCFVQNLASILKTHIYFFQKKNAYIAFLDQNRIFKLFKNKL